MSASPINPASVYAFPGTSADDSAAAAQEYFENEIVTLFKAEELTAFGSGLLTYQDAKPFFRTYKGIEMKGFRPIFEAWTAKADKDFDNLRETLNSLKVPEEKITKLTAFFPQSPAAVCEIRPPEPPMTADEIEKSAFIAYLVIAAVPKIAPYWYQLGIELYPDERVYLLETIRNDPQHSDLESECTAMLLNWLDMIHKLSPERLFKKLINGVKAPGLSKFSDAGDLNDKFKSQMAEIKRDFILTADDTGEDKLTMRFIQDSVIPRISRKWQSLCLVLLGKNWGELDRIGKNNPKDINACLKRVFEKVLQEQPNYSLSRLDKLLRAFQLNSAADEISQVYRRENSGRHKAYV